MCGLFLLRRNMCDLFSSHISLFLIVRNVGQALDWGSQHKRICRRYNRYIASESYQAMAAHERMDALLLSHLVAYISCLESPIEDESSPIYTFLSLLRGPVDVTVPSLCYETSAVSRELALELYSRFGNNNFAMHSHLNTYGHGIFPLASRLFNHSCVPNAAVKYITTSAQRVQMEVVALRPILPNEEVRWRLNLSLSVSSFTSP